MLDLAYHNKAFRAFTQFTDKTLLILLKPLE